MFLDATLSLTFSINVLIEKVEAASATLVRLLFVEIWISTKISFHDAGLSNFVRRNEELSLYLALLFFPLDRLPSHFSQLPPQAFAFVGFSFKTRYIWIGEFIYLRVYLSIAELEVRSKILVLVPFHWNLDFHEEIILQCGAFQLRTTKWKTFSPFDSPFLTPTVYCLDLANFLLQPLLPLFLLFRRVAVSYLHWQIYSFIYLLHKEFKLQARCSGLVSFCWNLDLLFTVCDFPTSYEETQNSFPLWLFFFSLDRLPSLFSKLPFLRFWLRDSIACLKWI